MTRSACEGATAQLLKPRLAGTLWNALGPLRRKRCSTPHRASAVVQPGQLGGEPATYRGDPADHPDHGIAYRPGAGGPQRRHPRCPVGEAHYSFRNRPSDVLVLVEPGLVRPSTEHRCQCATERNRILDTGVHPLPARWAVDVRSVASEQDPPGAVAIGQAVVDQEPGAPDDLLNAGRLRHPPRVQEAL